MRRSAQASDGTTSQEADACPLDSPLSGRIPGVLALVALPAAVFVKPLFFSVAASLLALLSLLLAPAGCRCLGAMGLLGAVTVATALLFGPA
jgi:hypothetical protein